MGNKHTTAGLLSTSVSTSVSDELIKTNNETAPCEGWLSKQKVTNLETSIISPTALTNLASGWNDRYFMIQRGNLVYFQVNAHQVFDLANLQSAKIIDQKPIQLHSTNIGYQFELIFTDDQRVRLAALTLQDAKLWVEILNGHEQEHRAELFMLIGKSWRVCHVICEICKVRGDDGNNKTLQIYQLKQRGLFTLYQSKLTIVNLKHHIFVVVDTVNKKLLTLCAHSKGNFDKWTSSLMKEIDRCTLPRQTISRHESFRDLKYLDKLRKIVESEKSRMTTSTSTAKANDKFVILSIDGGGIRGILNNVLLQKVVVKFPDFMDQIDMFCGTSNGGMSASALAFGFSPTVCRSLTEFSAKTVFGEKKTMTGINQSKYNNKYLKFLCDEAFEKNTIRDSKKYLAIPTLCLDGGIHIKIHQNLTDRPGDCDKMMTDVVMQTIAAPTYFPAWQKHIDGGMYAQDPSSIALTLALDSGFRLDQIVMLSFGTGTVLRKYDSEHFDWGYKQWLPKLLNVVWDSMVDKSQWMCKTLLGESFIRVDPILDGDVPLDDPLQIPKLTEIADEFDLTGTFEFIDKKVYGNTGPSAIESFTNKLKSFF